MNTAPEHLKISKEIKRSDILMSIARQPDSHQVFVGSSDGTIYDLDMMAEKPELDENNKLIGWKKFSRFVVNQDTGSAIRGKARADLYFGTGRKAGAMAGHYHEKAEVYYLIKKS